MFQSVRAFACLFVYWCLQFSSCPLIDLHQSMVSALNKLKLGGKIGYTDNLTLRKNHNYSFYDINAREKIITDK